MTCACHATGTAFAPPCDVPGGCGSLPTTDAPGQGRPRPDASPDTRERPAPDLGAVVRALIEPTVRAVPIYRVRDGELVAEVVDRQVGSVLAELRESVAPSGEAGGGGRGGGYAALDPAMLDALDAIRSTAADWLGLLGLRERRGSGQHRTEDALRRLVVHHWSGDHLRRDQLARILDGQRRHAERVLAGDSSRYMRATRCPLPGCHAESVREEDGTTHPPLRVDRAPSRDPDGRPGPILGTRCTACSTWWPWSAMGEGGPLAVAIERDRAEHQADQPDMHSAALRAQERDRRAALYGTVEGSAMRMGLPVPCRVCGLPATGGALCPAHAAALTG